MSAADGVRYDARVEQTVLAATLTGSDPLPLLAAVKPADFWVPLHEEVWRTVDNLAGRGTPIDPTTIRADLDARGITHDPAWLLDLLGMAAVTVDGTWHAARVAEDAAFRRLAAAATRAHQAANDRGLSLSDAQAIATAAIDEATRATVTAGPTAMRDVLAEVIDIADKGATAGLPTRWPDIDRLTGGIGAGHLIIVGAAPGTGKSILGANLAAHVAERHGEPVLVVSLEMPRLELAQRMVADRAGVNLSSLRDGRLTETQWGDIRRHHDAIEALPIHISDHPQQTVTAIRTQARDLARTAPLRLIVVDYLQLLDVPDRKGRSRAEQVTELSRGLKLLARESGATVMALAQVNREGFKHGAKPTMADLREGGMEADADQVWLLHRPEVELPTVEVLVDKNRHGPTGRAELMLVGHYARLGSVQREPDRHPYAS